MIRFPLLFCTALGMAACQTDDSLAGSGQPVPGMTEWHLQTIDGRPFPARATLTFGQNGAILGKAPCNSFSARNTADLPGFALGPVRSTRRACPELDAEQTYIDSLRSMTQADQKGSTLVLTNGAGREMVFGMSAP